MTGSGPAGALFLLATSITAGFVSYALVAWDRVDLLAVVTKPDAILLLVAINAVVGAIRISAAGDAWHRAGGRILGAGMLSLLLFTAIPHVALGYIGLETRATILTVFAAPDPTPIASATTSTEATTTTTLPTPASPAPTWTVYAGSSTATVPATTTTTLPLGSDRVTFLLLGSDAGPGRPGDRTDSVMVATINTLTGDTAIFGLPRNMAGFNFSDGTPFEGFSRGILNEVYMWGQRNPGRFEGPDPGIAAIEDVTETLLGIPIDYFVMIDMVGFARLVDVLGGVEVDVAKPMQAPVYDRATGEHQMIEFAPGRQRLDGDRALAFARSRTGSNDYARMSRQRCLISSLADEAGPLTLATRFPALLDLIETSLATNIPVNDLPYLINLVPKVNRDRTVVVGFDLEYRTGQLTARGYAIPDVGKIQATVQSVISSDFASAPPALATALNSCG
jgi:polyisoprenyl-teichoic acid--peptidoglycan teichoic acid transferase